MLITIESIKDKLHSTLSPDYLEVIDDSMLHQEHLDVEAGSVTHITIKISSQDLKSATKVAAHQMIYKTLKNEIDAGLHAISIKIQQ